MTEQKIHRLVIKPLNPVSSGGSNHVRGGPKRAVVQINRTWPDSEPGNQIQPMIIVGDVAWGFADCRHRICFGCGNLINPGEALPVVVNLD